jgi:hypothetical protein
MSVPWYEVDIGLEYVFYCFEAVLITTLITNILQYAVWLEKVKPKSRRNYTATWYILLSLPLNLAMPYAIVFIYVGKYGYPGSKMWVDGSWVPNTPLGITLWVMKYVGFVLLTIGILKITNLIGKIKAKWRRLRAPE